MDVPAHIAIIMDGNRRWASRHDKATIEGHKAGFEALKQTSERALELGVQELSVFAFSAENWKRSQEEVAGLLDLLRHVMDTRLEELHEQNIRIRVVGSRNGVSEDLQASFDHAEAKTKDNDRGTLNVLFNYGGRGDIVEAVSRLVAREGVSPEDIDEQLVSDHLSTAGMRDVDLLIRTTEYRLSGFLPWETVYAEIYFQPDVLWPDFDGEELEKAIQFYNQRQRRFGK